MHLAFSDDASRWRALETRDANADGCFIYAVTSTRIYCRPTCKARLARRANVVFYETGQHAQDAGFRTCKRCKPDVAGLMPEEAATRKIRAYLCQHQRQGQPAMSTGSLVSLKKMAEDAGLSKWHFHRVFKRCTGLTPTEYLKMQRPAPQYYAGLEIADATSVSFLDAIDDAPSMPDPGPWHPLSVDDLLLSWPDDATFSWTS
jgi:methylphosphotriester-DNA--protein-cysteine methyltransferase